jgi:hypothetical protein
MIVIKHQAIREQINVCLPEVACEARQKEPIVLCFKKNALSVIPAVIEVVEVARIESGGHGKKSVFPDQSSSKDGLRSQLSAF